MTVRMGYVDCLLMDATLTDCRLPRDDCPLGMSPPVPYSLTSIYFKRVKPLQDLVIGGSRVVLRVPVNPPPLGILIYSYPYIYKYSL